MKTDTNIVDKIPTAERNLLKSMGLYTTDYTAEIKKIDIEKFYRTIGVTATRVFVNIIEVSDTDPTIRISENDAEYTDSESMYTSLSAEVIESGRLKEFNIYDNATIIRLSNTESKVYKTVVGSLPVYERQPIKNIWVVLWKSEISSKYLITDFIIQSLGPQVNDAIGYHMSSMCNVYEKLMLKHIRLEIV